MNHNSAIKESSINHPFLLRLRCEAFRAEQETLLFDWLPISAG
jgi:hypothetical protein